MTLFQRPLVWCVLAIINLMPLQHSPSVGAMQTESSQCIQCHTNLKKLMYPADVKAVVAAAD